MYFSLNAASDELGKKYSARYVTRHLAGLYFTTKQQAHLAFEKVNRDNKSVKQVSRSKSYLRLKPPFCAQYDKSL